MSRKLTKKEAERLIAALDAPGDDADRLLLLRNAVATVLASLLGRPLPWPELIDAAAVAAGWPAERARRLCDDSIEGREVAIDALYDLITELNETRTLTLVAPERRPT